MFPSPLPSSVSSWLNLLQNSSSNVGEKSWNTTRPVRQQVGEETSDREDVDDDDDDNDSGTMAEQWCEEKNKRILLYTGGQERRKSCVLSEL